MKILSSQIYSVRVIYRILVIETVAAIEAVNQHAAGSVNLRFLLGRKGIVDINGVGLLQQLQAECWKGYLLSRLVERRIYISVTRIRISLPEAIPNRLSK